MCVLHKEMRQATMYWCFKPWTPLPISKFINKLSTIVYHVERSNQNKRLERFVWGNKGRKNSALFNNISHKLKAR